MAANLPMNILVNALTITDGGGIVVLIHLIESIQALDPGIHWYVVAEPHVLARFKHSGTINKITYSWARKSPLHLLFWYEITLPKLIRRVNATLCFSYTNFLSRRQLPCPSLLLIHNAGFFSKRFTEMHLAYYTRLRDALIWKQKTKWVYASIKRATLVTVQTNALANRIINHTKISPSKIITIPHGIGLLNGEIQSIKTFQNVTAWRLGYITKFGVQKDFITAFKAMHYLKKNRIPAKLILTLNPALRENDLILQQVKLLDIQDRVENIGDIIHPEEIKKVYESLDCFIFPSLIESFGFTLVEAMAMGLPILAADTESNREIVGSGGEFFIAENDRSLYASIIRLMNDPVLYHQSALHSLERSKTFNWEKAAKIFIEKIYQLRTVGNLSL